MTFEELSQLIEKYNIPKDVTLMSDSGWEYDAADMDGVYYNKEKNVLVFTMSIEGFDVYFRSPEWKCLFSDKIYGNINDCIDTENKNVKLLPVARPIYGGMDDAYSKIDVSDTTLYAIGHNEVAGYAGFKILSETELKLEIYVREAYRGFGYGELVINALVKAAFSWELESLDDEGMEVVKLKPEKIKVYVPKSCEAGCHLMEKCGFQKVGSNKFFISSEKTPISVGGEYGTNPS